METSLRLDPQALALACHVAREFTQGLTHPLSLPERIVSILQEMGYPHAAVFLQQGRKQVMEAARGGRANGKARSLRTPLFSGGTILTTPVVLNGKTVGYLVLDGKAEEPFSPQDRAVAEVMAVTLAVALGLGQGPLRGGAGLRDCLTGVHNREYLDLRLEEEVALAKRKGHPLSVALLDVDGLKEVNDRLGHLAGDEALKAVGKALRHNLRACDGVARYGGDEFVILMPETTRDQAVTAIRRLLGRLSHLRFQAQERSYPLPSASYGIATFPEEGQDPHSLLNAADHALYRSKGTGRRSGIFSD